MTIAEKNEYGFEIIEDAMEMLVSIYNTVPRDELDDTPVAFPAHRICEVLEMFFAYVHDAEGVDVVTGIRRVALEHLHGGVGGRDGAKLAGIEKCRDTFGVGFRFRGSGDSKIEQLHCSVVSQKAVAGF